MKLFPPKDKKIKKDGKEFLFACFNQDIHEGTGKRIVIDDNTELAIFKIQGELFCLSNFCPHNHSPKIFEGYIQNFQIFCPEHGWSFDLKTGKNLSSAKDLLRYDVFEERGYIWIEAPQKEKPKWMSSFEENVVE